MELFVCKSELAVKGISILILWGLRCLYYYYKELAIVNDSISNEALDEDEIEDKDIIKDITSVTPLPMASKMVNKRPQATSFPQVTVANARLSQPASGLIEKRKASFNRKRKLFRNALLMHVIMERKDFIA